MIYYWLLQQHEFYIKKSISIIVIVEFLVKEFPYLKKGDYGYSRCDGRRYL